MQAKISKDIDFLNGLNLLISEIFKSNFALQLFKRTFSSNGVALATYALVCGGLRI